MTKRENEPRSTGLEYGKVHDKTPAEYQKNHNAKLRILRKDVWPVASVKKTFNASSVWNHGYPFKHHGKNIRIQACEEMDSMRQL